MRCRGRRARRRCGELRARPRGAREVATMSTPSAVAEPLISGLYFGECPRWHEGRLWFSDFYDHRVCSVTSAGDQRTEVEFAGEPAGLGWLPDGRLLINSRRHRPAVRRE